MDISVQRRLCYGKVERSNAGRPSVERGDDEDSKDISEGGKQPCSIYFNKTPEKLGERELRE